jgi:FMN phosphatase YigB (HAD superfamily)
MIKAIIFDCFGVLTTDTWNAFLDTLPEGVDIGAAREVHRAYDAGLIDKQACSQQIQEITGSVFTELEDFSGEVIKNSALLDHIRHLGQQYKTGLLSNIGSNWIRDHFLSAEEQSLFDSMVFSYEVGANKPDERMYEAIVERLGVAFSEAVMIDDKLVYCEAAKVLGMQAIVYQDLAQFKKDLEPILD